MPLSASFPLDPQVVLGSLDRFTLTGLTKAAARQAVNKMGLAGAQSEAAISAVSRATRQSVVNVSQYGSDVRCSGHALWSRCAIE
jgi:hypothetical protein